METKKRPGGCMGKVLSVNLSHFNKKNKEVFKEVEIDSVYYEKLLTGYGLASKIISDNQESGLSALDEKNIFAVMSGLLTSTGALFSGRFMICGKSPLTGTWGDANCGGYFAPAIKKTGYDGFFFTGKSESPVYLYIDDKTTELRDARELWGKDSYETQDELIKKYGTNFKVACIGPGGEQKSFLAGVVTDGGRLAARGGLGALMGSKNLKAICLGASRSTTIEEVESISRADVAFIDSLNSYKHLWMDKMVSKAANSSFLSGLIRFLSKTPLWEKIDTPEVERYIMKTYGTAGSLAVYANTGISPIRNWTGIAWKNFPTRLAKKISADSVIAFNESRYGCHHCPLACGAEVDVEKFNKKAPGDLFKLRGKRPGAYSPGPHKPEYETLCGFGDMILNDSIYAIIKVNDLCNRAGIDTISTAVTCSWAFEAFENGDLTLEDTGGLELKWGKNKKTRQKAAETLVKLVEKIVTAKKSGSDSKGIGEMLFDGVERAAAYLDRKKGTDSMAYAMNCGKQELPMYDTRNKQMIYLAVSYEVEPTPGRHTSSMPGVAESYMKGSARPDVPEGLAAIPDPVQHKRKFAHSQPEKKVKPKNEDLKDAVSLATGSKFEDIVNGCGLCNFAFGLVVDKDGTEQLPLITWLNSATGWNKTIYDYLEAGHRIKTIRKLFNYTKCGGPDTDLPRSATYFKSKCPPVTKDTREAINTLRKQYYQVMGYDEETGKPLDKTLDDLGINGLPPIKL